MMDSIILVYWYSEAGIRQMLAFENLERAYAYMNAHPYRTYRYTQLSWYSEGAEIVPRKWFPQ